MPSPPHLTAVHIHRLDKIHFFGWTSDSVIHMPIRKQIPQLSVVRLRSQGVNLQQLRQADFTTGFPRPDLLRLHEHSFDSEAMSIAQHLKLPANLESATAVARQWTRGIPRGWLQVEEIVRRLRTEFTLDMDALAPETCNDVVSHFLEAGRGPDYMFAATAAMQLRKLGYPTRLVAGFYARPERFDQRARQTEVLAEDVHMWAEVYVGDHAWVPIEPTPGYDCLLYTSDAADE